jgi:hypothetical protein
MLAEQSKERFPSLLRLHSFLLPSTKEPAMPRKSFNQSMKQARTRFGAPRLHS